MPNYQNGKIYTLRTHNNPDLIYVGSTTQTLAKRKIQHKSACKNESMNNVSSKKIIEAGNYYIELVEKYPCESKEELFEREAYYIRKIKCVNKVILCRTRNEYLQDNKDKISKQQKEYRERNMNKIKEYRKKYNEENKDEKSKANKIYREKNKEKINLKYREKDTCDCGSIGTVWNKTRHERTKKHKKYIESLKIVNENANEE